MTPEQPIDRVNVDEVMRDIRERARQKQARTPVRTHVLSASGGARTALQTLSVAQIGDLPPSPPTLRGRVGAIAVRVIYHALHWYTVRLRQFASAVKDSAARQADRIDELCAAVEDATSATQSQAAEIRGLLERQARDLRELRSACDDEHRAIREDHTRDINHWRERHEDEVERFDVQLRAIREELAALRRELEETRAAPESIRELERRTLKMKSDMTVQERRITILLEEARKRLPAPFEKDQLERLAGDRHAYLEALYSSFEDQYRGTREDIIERLRFYVPYVTGAKSVIDIGCGRGEWLELLRDIGIQAKGVDSNSVMVQRCRDLGLCVTQADFLQYLRSLPDGSIDALTAFHLVEHLPWPGMIDLLDEAVRVLRTGGVLIVETPNPGNVLVSTHNFYLDPTHNHPIPSTVARFLVEARGLCGAEVIPLHPYPPALAIAPDSSELIDRFNQLMYGPQDYAVVARKV